MRAKETGNRSGVNPIDKVVASTGEAAITFATSLGLSESAQAEVVASLQERAQALPVVRGRHVASWLGNIAEALAAPTQAEAVVTNPESTSEVHEILGLAADTKLKEHKEPNPNTRTFISEVFPDLTVSVRRLNPKELSLLGIQIINSYSAMEIPSVKEKRKVGQREKLERYFGLFEDPKELEVIAEDLGITKVALQGALKRIGEYLSDGMDSAVLEGMIAKIEEAKEIGLEALFIPKVQIDPAKAAAEAEEERVIMSPVEDVELFQHARTPRNAWDFLEQIFPEAYHARLKYLEPEQASKLTRRFVEIFKRLAAESTMTEEAISEREVHINRYTGLNGTAKDFVEIAQARALTSNGVKRGIERTAEQLQKRIGEKRLAKLLEEAFLAST